MSSRPRRSAAARAKEVISVHARWADTSEKEDAGTTMSSRRTGRGAGASTSHDAASSPEETHLSVTVKLPPSRQRQTARGGNRRVADPFEGGEIVIGKRNRGAKKSYVIDSSPDDEEEEEEEEVEVEDEEEDEEDDDEEDEEDTRAEDDDEMEELGDEDAEGEDEMDVDAEGEEDADGDVDMAPKSVARPLAKNSRSTKPRPTVKVTTSRAHRDEDDDEDDDDDDDDDELSDPADSDIGDDTIVYGDQTMVDDEDAEGEEIEVAGDDDDVEEEEDEEEEEDDEITLPQAANGDSDLDSEEGSRAETPDLAKMTKRQRARFEDIPQEFMKLPDEIQVKKVFTAEELSMRRQEMARRRRNLSEKRNEEVKMETINKLLKKQAPKINRKAAAAAAAADSQGHNLNRANPVFIRWISNKSGSRIAVPDEIIEGPSGTVFGDKTQQSRKLVTEVA